MKRQLRAVDIGSYGMRSSPDLSSLMRVLCINFSEARISPTVFGEIYASLTGYHPLVTQPEELFFINDESPHPKAN